MAFGRTSGEHGAAGLFTEETGDLLAAGVWIGFGALALGPVAAAPHLAGRPLRAAQPHRRAHGAGGPRAARPRGPRAPTIAFIGWFGPRGLASVVFGLLVLERGVPEQNTLLATVPSPSRSASSCTA